MGFNRQVARSLLCTCQSPWLRVSLTREWLGPGGLPGLQNRWRVALRAAVGSTPIHSRLFVNDGRVASVFLAYRPPREGVGPRRGAGGSWRAGETIIFHGYYYDFS